MFNTTVLNIFVETGVLWIESLNEQPLFEMEIFCNVINVFAVTWSI